MEFLVIALDRADAGDLRQRIRLAHLEYVAERQQNIKFGGPILTDDGRIQGSCLILEFPDRAALDRHLAGDPYFKSDLFEAVFIRQTRQVVPESTPGQMAQEVARQKAKA